MEAEAKSQPHEPFEVRPATRDDVSAIATMQKKSLPETYEPFLGRAAVEEFVAHGNVERYFEKHWRQSTVATLGGEVVVVAGLIDGLLDLIRVKPSARSKGIGAALIEAIKRRAAGEIGELTLEVWTVNGALLTSTRALDSRSATRWPIPKRASKSSSCGGRLVPADSPRNTGRER